MIAKKMPSKTYCAVTTLIALGWVPGSPAQGYPERPVRLIVPLSAGGSADIVGRQVAQKLSEKLGQQFVIDNRPGAGSLIGTEIAARAPHDGYTLLLAGSSFTTAPSLQRKLPYDPLKDFAPITMAAAAPGLLVVNPSLPVRTVKELIALARAKPGLINYASPGVGTSPHFAGALFNMMAGVELVHIPYKGAGPAITDVVAGQVQLSFASMPSVMSNVKSGRLRAVAVTGLKRSFALPELPTVAESGLPGFETRSWQGLFAPTGTPSTIVNKLYQEVAAVVRLPDIVAALAQDGSEPVASSPSEFSKWLPGELAKWVTVAKAAKLKAD